MEKKGGGSARGGYWNERGQWRIVGKKGGGSGDIGMKGNSGG